MLIRRLLCSTNVAALMISAGSGTVPVFSENYITGSTSALTFARSGHAMMYDSTGKLTYAPNNMLTYSNTFSNAAWTKTNVTVTGGQTDPLGGSNASTLTATAGNGTCTQTTAAFTSNGQNTLWIKRKTGTGTIELSKPDGTYTTVSVTGSWAQYTANYQGASATGAFNIRIVTNGDEIYVYSAAQSLVTYETSARSVDDVITTSAAYYGPRFEYNPATLAKAGWLIEGEARTNAVTYSEDLTTTWATLNTTVSANAATSPDGTTTADLLYPTTTGNNRWIYNSVSGQNTNPVTQSFYVKAAGLTWACIYNEGGGGAGAAWFNLSNGTVGTVVAGYTAKIQDVGNGWYRISLYTASAGNNFIIIGGVDGDNSIAATTSGTNGIYVWGAQGEVSKTFASSYIRTTSATVTRAAESVTGTTAAVGYNASTGTLIVEADSPDASQQALVGGFNSSGGANDISIWKSNTSASGTGTNIVGREYDGTETVVNPATTVSGGTSFRAGVRWDTGGGATGFGISINGGATTSGQVRTPTPTTFRLGVRDDGYPLIGHVRLVEVYDVFLG